MSHDYASALSEYENKGVCGIPEVHDPEYLFEQKVTVLTEMLRNSTYTVVHTGAGLSTSSGIPDFRGPNGVWTLEKVGKKPKFSRSFPEARPSVGHMALVALERAGYINFLVTQNIDGLHLRSGFPRNRLAILHGDVFMESCATCGATYVRDTKTVPTFGLKFTGATCNKLKTRVRRCGGKLKDSVLDWEDELTEPDYSLAVKESKSARLHLCLGLSPYLLPSGLLPLSTAAWAPGRSRFHMASNAATAAGDGLLAQNGHHRGHFDLSTDLSCLAAKIEPGISEAQVDEYISQYLLSGASLTSGDEALSSAFLAPPSGIAKQMKWSRGVPVRGRRKKNSKANLHICLGTSLQIYPAADLPFSSKRQSAPAITRTPSRRKRKHPQTTSEEALASSTVSANGDSQAADDVAGSYSATKVVIVNLQPTKLDARADICMRTEIDRVLTRVCQNLGVEIPPVKEESGPFIPKILLRSKYTTKAERFPWTVLPHPENTIPLFADDETNYVKTEEAGERKEEPRPEPKPESTKEEKDQCVADNKPEDPVDSKA